MSINNSDIDRREQEFTLQDALEDRITDDIPWDNRGHPPAPYAFSTVEPTAQPSLLEYQSLARKVQRDAFKKVKRWTRHHFDLFITLPVFLAIMLCFGFWIWPAQGLSISWQGWVAFSILMLLLASLVSNLGPPHALFIVALVLLMVFDIIDTDDALSGFGSSTTITIAALFSLTKGIQESTLLFYAIKYLLGKPKSAYSALLRIFPPLIAMASVLSTTSVVSLMVPVIDSWSRASQLPANQLYLPVNMIVICGGTLTIIGSSSSLLVITLVQEYNPHADFNFFAPFLCAAPICLISAAFLIGFSPLLIRAKRTGLENYLLNPQSYITPAVVKANSSLPGKAIGASELAVLKNMNIELLKIMRGEETIVAPKDDVVLCANDNLLFAGPAEVLCTVLYNIDGLRPIAEKQIRKLEEGKRCLVTAIVSSNSRLIGCTAVQVNFRKRYGAAIIAVHRRGQDVTDSLHNLEFEGGDGLLLETTSNFLKYEKREMDFVVISNVGLELKTVLSRKRPFHAVVALCCVLFIAVMSAFNWISLVLATLIAVLVLVAFRTMSTKQAVNAIKLPNLIIVGCSLAISSALQDTGVAENLATSFLSLISNQFLVLSGVFLVTGVLANFIGGSAAVSIVFPIAIEVTRTLPNITYTEMGVVLMIASSASVVTTWSRSASLITVEAGGYSFLDFLKFGIPIFIVMYACTTLIVYFF